MKHFTVKSQRDHSPHPCFGADPKDLICTVPLQAWVKLLLCAKCLNRRKGTSTTQSKEDRNILRPPLFTILILSPKSGKDSVKCITQLSTAIEKAIKTWDNHVPVCSDKEAFKQAAFGELMLLPWLEMVAQNFNIFSGKENKPHLYVK